MKTKEIILKESPNTDEETLEHCLTAIQAMLDMDDFERAYNYLNGFVSEIIAQTREETIREVEERESIKLVHEKAFNCPTLSIQCNHDFKFSHTEEENKLGSNVTTAGTMPPRLFDVVVCSKCGEIRKSLKYLTN